MTPSLLHLKKSTRGVLLPLFLALFSFTFANASEEFRIKKTILSYNMTLIEAAKAPNFLKVFDDQKKLEKFASKEVAQKLYIWIKSWHENGLYMDAEIKDIRFGKVLHNKNEASVLTDEVWNYGYFRVSDKNIKKEAYPKKLKEYKVKYWLKNFSNRWKIVKIEILKDVEKDL